jgi:hypothetical protein
MPSQIENDDEDEILQMQRGRYSAWMHVVVAFLYQIGLVGGPVMLLAQTAGEGFGMFEHDATTMGLVIGGVTGLVAAFFVFRGRWSKAEAFASRYTSGIANISLLYVPHVALYYVNRSALKALFARRDGS